MIKNIGKWTLVIFILLVLGYLGQVHKACVVENYRLRDSFDKGKITEKEYIDNSKNNTFWRMLFNPKIVINID